MIKQGVVKPGKTPSAISNKVSTKIVDGEALAEDETEKDLIKTSSVKFDKEQGGE